MNRTYVGSTIYHLYLSIIHLLRSKEDSLNSSDENLLFLIESTPFIETLIPNLEKSFFTKVHILSRRREHVNDLGKLNYTFNRKNSLVPYLEEKHPILKKKKNFIMNSDIYLCDTNSSQSYFLYEFGHIGLNMIEDGARTYGKGPSKFEKIFKGNITKTLIGSGYDKEIVKLFAQFPDKLPLQLRSKAVELNIEKEVAKLDEKTKKDIFEIFLSYDNFKLDNKNNALILTQPISEDGIVKDEEVKINMYRDLISKVPSHLNVILKTHPREKTKYEDHFKDIIVLPGLFPIEILALKDGFYFEQGYTLFSTALSNLEIVKEHFFLGKEYLDKFTSQSTKDLIQNMVLEKK
ncbi:MAG: polysialyltransferase family glycosyltransferase [Maribacter sp.]